MRPSWRSLGGERELGDASVTQHLALAGLFDTTLEFDWFASIFGDSLDVLLSLDDTIYGIIATFPLNVASFQHVSLALPQADNQPSVFVRFQSNTASHIDNVAVSAAAPIPEPSTVVLVGFALLGLWLAAQKAATREIGARPIHHVPHPSGLFPANEAYASFGKPLCFPTNSRYVANIFFDSSCSASHLPR